MPPGPAPCCCVASSTDRSLWGPRSITITGSNVPDLRPKELVFRGAYSIRHINGELVLEVVVVIEPVRPRRVRAVRAVGVQEHEGRHVQAGDAGEARGVEHAVVRKRGAGDVGVGRIARLRRPRPSEEGVLCERNAPVHDLIQRLFGTLDAGEGSCCHLGIAAQVRDVAEFSIVEAPSRRDWIPEMGDSGRKWSNTICPLPNPQSSSHGSKFLRSESRF
ncbi:hypothetical protein BJ166DRAFT_507829 [Pestalotiopsis sp. NC0098]|nr:hypothetical protein BJ166DRAFT_507829 [Pestalotiopsis sp. NC0098]